MTKYIISLFLIGFGLIFAVSAGAEMPVKLPDAGKSEWIAQCGESGGYSACENLADQHLKGLYGVPKNRKMTAYYLLKACRYGNWEMCEFAYGMANNVPDGKFIRAESSLLLCENDAAKYCAGVWLELKDDTDFRLSPPIVGAALNIGCEKGDITSCQRLATWFDKDRTGLNPDPAKAAFGYEKACFATPDGKLVKADTLDSYCFFAYKYFAGDMGVPRNAAKAKRALIRSCEFGDQETCALALSSFHHGINGIDKDADAALAMADRACDLGYSIACDSSAYIHYTRGDHDKAFAAFAANCDRSPNLYSCAGAAAEAYTAKGPEHAQTTKYAKLACEQKDGWACYTYAQNTFYLDQNGNQHLFQKACNYGSKEGCAEVERRKAWEKARDEAIRARTATMVASPAPTYTRPSSGNWYKPPTTSYIAAPIKRSYHQQQNYNYSTCMSNRSNWGTC